MLPEQSPRSSPKWADARVRWFNELQFGSPLRSRYKLVSWSREWRRLCCVRYSNGQWSILASKPINSTYSNWHFWFTGFYNEELRADRDSYVDINWDNIDEGTCLRFYISSERNPADRMDRSPYLNCFSGCFLHVLCLNVSLSSVFFANAQMVNGSFTKKVYIKGWFEGKFEWKDISTEASLINGPSLSQYGRKHEMSSCYRTSSQR